LSFFFSSILPAPASPQIMRCTEAPERCGALELVSAATVAKVVPRVDEISKQRFAMWEAAQKK
jgi:hypothetical protein